MAVCRMPETAGSKKSPLMKLKSLPSGMSADTSDALPLGRKTEVRCHFRCGSNAPLMTARSFGWDA